MNQAYNFISPNRRELIAGGIYIPMHLIVMQLILGLVFLLLEYFLDTPIDFLAMNIVFQAVACIYLCIFMFQYLRWSWLRFMEYGIKNLWAILLGYAILMALALPLGILMELFVPDLPSPNQEAVEELIGENFALSFLMAVILAPFVEELLFRGVLFAPFLKRSRVLAYTISSLAFAFMHIVGFLIMGFSPILFVTMLIYIPHSLALCWVYEKTGSIWTAIFLHAFNNVIALLLVQFAAPYIMPY